ncbi:hypothetical protein [Hymenobacter lucidus]|uniref:Uncharacterized protein n=1 Tax=Hymenobacter lucidus TaxID=2880930 RepID=A0ABS8APX4_9BACT|nr:hypothetical protein [Hymenobacter lucidus]MCB2407469.1 hypothetical protein [Hymenobacter lucidus]
MNPSTSTQPTASARFRLLLIGLGWLGLVLFAVDWLVDGWKFETTSYALLRVFDLIKNVLFALWPVAVWLQLSARISDAWRFWAGILLVLVTIPCWLSCGFLLVFEDSAVWEDEKVQYESADPPVRIVQQYRDTFPTNPTQYRVVKITPLWGPWQHVEPADSARFPEEHYR